MNICFTECEEGVNWGTNCDNPCDCSIQVKACITTTGCSDTDEGGASNCLPGWMGYNCTDDFDECNKSTFSCPVNSECVNTIGSYNCECKKNYAFNPGGSTCLGM